MSASSARSYDTIKYEVSRHKATITLNRPDALNALSPHMITELRDAYSEAENDLRQAVRALFSERGRPADVLARTESGEPYDQQLWRALADRYSEPQLIELIVLVGQYHVVSYLANALGVGYEDNAARFPAAG